jgi:uncharacterized protein (TIGR02246 family)
MLGSMGRRRLNVEYETSVRVDAGPPEAAVAALYEQLIDGWNARDGERFAAPFAESGTAVGFDGSEMNGRDTIAAELERVFEDHQTAAYVARVRALWLLRFDVALLRSVVGMIPADGSAVDRDKNAHQTVLAVKDGPQWRIVLLQNTPAQYHGRPELVDELTAELQQVADRL